MDFTVLTADDIHVIRAFLDEDVYDGFSTNNRYAITVSEKGSICGVGIFDVSNLVEIVDIKVLPQYTGELEQELLREILWLCDSLPCKAISMTIYESADQFELEKSLINIGFSMQQEKTLYHFFIKHVLEQRFFSLENNTKGVFLLKDIGSREKKAFSNHLIREGLFDRFLDEDISEDYSTVYVKDGGIKGCCLVSNISESVFCLEFVYIEKQYNNLKALSGMFKMSGELLSFQYDDLPSDCYTLVTNKAANELFTGLVPDYDITDRCRTYVIPSMTDN